MKVAIIGSRNISSSEYERLINEVPVGCSEVISGGAAGADQFAEKFAQENGLPISVFLPQYEKSGKSAPLERNIQIVEAADYVLALWDGTSRGTANAILTCIKSGTPVKIFICKEKGEAQQAEIVY